MIISQIQIKILVVFFKNEIFFIESFVITLRQNNESNVKWIGIMK